MAKRKTVQVEKIRTMVNKALGFGFYDFLQGMTPEQAYRRGQASVLETILLETDNYKGFGYLPSEVNENGTLRDGYDDTRRKYF